MENLQSNNDLDSSYISDSDDISPISHDSNDISLTNNSSIIESNDDNHVQEKPKLNKGGPKADEAHLANECLQCPENIRKYWQEKLISEKNNYKRSTRNNIIPPLGQQSINDHFNSNKELPPAINKRIDHSLIKAWIMAEIPFEVIENPFIIDLFHELNPGFTPPSRFTLSGRLLDQEISRINLKIDKKLETSNNLTLTLDGWTSKRNESLYNYIISTPSRKEYLIALKNYSSRSQTGKFLANEISTIVENIGSEKFAAVVTDAGSACRVARKKTQEMYSHIWDIRCAAHSLNLIAADLVKLDEIKQHISDCGKIIKFFNNSHQANSILRQGLIEMKIKSEGSLHMTTDSILRAKPVFDWILTEHPNIITNLEVINLIKNDNFFIICNQIRSVWIPIKMCINVLESNTATLANCFIYMIKLTIAIYRLSNLNPFKTPAIRIFNQRYMEFQHPAYLLCYFLHPLYRAKPVFDWILTEHPNIITNLEVINLIKNDNFFIICNQIRSVWIPIKMCINVLESNTATLANCFIYMIKLTIAIYRLSNLNPFKTPAIRIFNQRYMEFQHPAYLLCYFLHPLYRGRGLHNGKGFREVALIASKMWHNLNYNEQECKELIAQLRRFDFKLDPYDLPYVDDFDTPEIWWGSIRTHFSELALRLFGIIVSQANCERNFSTLRWMIGDYRTRLNVQKLEGMSKIRAYYMTNIKKELIYYGKELNMGDLKDVTNDCSIGNIVNLDNLDEEELSNNFNNNSEITSDRLVLEDIIDLSAPIFDNENINFENNKNNVNTNSPNFDYDPEQLVVSFLQEEM
ncbi:hypothetical protein Glove_480g14 [Diversispora epigaea]|uniref:DUF659 domain-containing protein n=1 Tax=Diversispora epigaea TaxID=1348612 RepID=A0A397GK48_9GLOM|nr:hypothetical protein Glove_480g14 [Diversispora epigaea]